MPETSSGMQAEARSRGARTPSGAKPRASRGVRKNAAAGGCWGGPDPREDRSNGFSSTTNRTNFHEWGAAAPSYSRVGTARFLASQDSGAQRLSCWMQWRPCRVSGTPTARRRSKDLRASARSVIREGHRPRMPHFQAAKRRFCGD